MSQEPTQLDSPWKDIIELHFEEFMVFFFPQVHALIDWGKDYEFLDKELQKAVRDAELGQRLVDKLVKVHLHNGETTHLYIHIEVQVAGFGLRFGDHVLQQAGTAIQELI